MYTKRLVALGLIVPILGLGLMILPARPAKASDDWAWALGGAVLGALLFSDQPHHHAYYEPPAKEVYYYPGARAYAFRARGDTAYYPYGHRYWAFAGYNWRGRPVYVPAARPKRLSGPYEIVTLGRARTGPVFRINIG